MNDWGSLFDTVFDIDYIYEIWFKTIYDVVKSFCSKSIELIVKTRTYLIKTFVFNSAVEQQNIKSTLQKYTPHQVAIKGQHATIVSRGHAQYALFARS